MESVRIRLAVETDWEDMLEITRDVWGGTDYLPMVWSRWLRDRAGALLVAELGHTVVGLLHVERQPENVAWIEGIRTAPHLRDRGIGEQLLRAGLDYASQLNCSLARLSTSDENPASNRIAEKTGMRVVGRFQPYRACPSEVQTGEAGLILVQPHKSREVLALLASRPPELCPTLYTEGWTARSLTDQRIRALCSAGSVVALAKNGKLRAAAIATCASPFEYLRLGALYGDEPDARELAGYVLRRAAEAGMTHIRATLAADARVDAALRSTGFARHRDFAMLLHEVRLQP